MIISDQIKTLSAALGVIVVLGGAVVWAQDQRYDDRYVQITALTTEFKRQRLESLSDQIDDLSLRVKLGQATALDKAKLEQLIRKREEMLKK